MICSAATWSAGSTDAIDIGLLLQLTVTAMGFFTLLAVAIIAGVICRRYSRSIGVYV